MNSNTNKALFLDRDGVINYDHDYVYKITEEDFIPGIFELAKIAKQKGYIIIVVTNQAGIGRGFYTEEDFAKITKFIEARFKENGTEISKTYYCPHHPEHGVGEYKKECDDRKPNPGMILKAQAEFNIDLKASLLVGDRETDIEAAIKAGITNKILFNAKKPGEKTRADFVAKDLSDIVKFL